MNLNRQYWTGTNISSLKDDEVFVFGSNPEGRNSAGAAKIAMSFGAWYGEGRGLYGKTYALVTKNLKRNFREPKTNILYEKIGARSVTPDMIRENIKEMYQVIRENPDKNFLISYTMKKNFKGELERSLNGYTGLDMLNMFMDDLDVPDNVVFHDSFEPFIKMKLDGLTNSSILKRLNMKNIKDAYSEALDKDEVKKTMINNKENFVFFWESSSVFSQWHPSKFEYKNITFICAEQFMMYSKAKLFNDHEVAQKIMKYNNSELGQALINEELTSTEIVNNSKYSGKWRNMMFKIKNLGKEVSGYTDEIWHAKRVPIVSVGNREKFNQNILMKRELMAIGSATLVEASPYDDIWGIGLKATDPNAQNRSTWRGLNLLGDDVLTNLKNHFLLENKTKNKNKIRP